MDFLSNIFTVLNMWWVAPVSRSPQTLISGRLDTNAVTSLLKIEGEASKCSSSRLSSDINRSSDSHFNKMKGLEPIARDAEGAVISFIPKT